MCRVVHSQGDRQWTPVLAFDCRWVMQEMWWDVAFFIPHSFRQSCTLIVCIMEFYIQQSILVFMTLLLPCISWYIALYGVLEFQNTERNKIKKQLFVNLGGGEMFSLFLYLMYWEDHKKCVPMCYFDWSHFLKLDQWKDMTRLRYYLFLTSEKEEHAYRNESFKDAVTVVQ